MTLSEAARTAAAMVLPLAAAALVLARLLGAGPRWPGRVLAASLSVGGLGLASLPVFTWRLLEGRLGLPFVSADFAAFALLTAGAAWLAQLRRPAAEDEPPGLGADRAAQWVGLGVLVLVAAAAVWGSTVQAERFPHGQWDAWAVWNLRARFLYRAADGRAALLADPPLSHFDYPLLLPASVARLWAYAGRETTLAPALLAFIYTFGAAAVCGAALLILRGGSVATAATLVALANSDFLVHGQSQYADVPAGYHLLAAVALLAWHDQMARPGGRPWALALAGLAAGLSAWTKNEGLLFVVAILAARSGRALWRPDRGRLRHEMAWLGAGLALPLAGVAIYKLATPHQSWLLDGQSGPLLDRILDAPRLRLVLVELGRGLLGFGSGAVLGAAAVAFVLRRGVPAREPGPLWPLGVVGVVLAGYVAVFLASPFDLRWHLETTVSRLLAQIWPVSVFAAFYAATTRPAPPPSPAAPRPPP